MDDKKYDYNYETREIKKKKPRGNGIFVIMAIVFSIIGGIIGSAVTGYQMRNKSSSTGEASNNITISASDNATIASAVAQKSMPSVVGITTKGVQQSFFGSVEVQGVGSGVIVDPKGYILTNAHVVKLNDQVVENVTVRLNDETDIQGKTIWADEMIDLAIVKIDTNEKLTAAELGDSDAINIGDPAIAIGNPLSLQFSQTVTQGIISGLDRYVGAVSGGGYMTGLIQTDASINGGNSGGPLLNSKGEVIGINTVKVQSAEGLGFSIPINFIKPIIKQVIETGTYKETSIGMLTMDVNTAAQIFGQKEPVEEGIFVYKVYDNSPAAAAGLEAGDIVTKIGKDDVKDNNSLKTILYKYQEGDSAEVTYLRNGKENTTQITFTDYSIEKDADAQKDMQEQEAKRQEELQRRQSTEDALLERFRQQFGN
ncbi:S1C family serine protease [Peptoniphilus ovalis]